MVLILFVIVVASYVWSVLCGCLICLLLECRGYGLYYVFGMVVCFVMWFGFICWVVDVCSVIWICCVLAYLLYGIARFCRFVVYLLFFVVLLRWLFCWFSFEFWFDCGCLIVLWYYNSSCVFVLMLAVAIGIVLCVSWLFDWFLIDVFGGLIIVVFVITCVKWFVIILVFIDFVVCLLFVTFDGVRLFGL